jgi:hypothetical protein
MGGNKNFNFFADRFFRKVDKNIFVLFVTVDKNFIVHTRYIL